MNQGKLDMVKQEIARLNVDILGINELEWTGMGEFNSDDHCIYYCTGTSRPLGPPRGAHAALSTGLPAGGAADTLARALRVQAGPGVGGGGS